MTGLAEIDAIKEEVKYWTDYAAAEKRKEKSISPIINVNSAKVSTKDNTNRSSIIQPVPLALNNNPIVSKSKKSSRALESNRRLQSMADMKRSNPNAFPYIGNNNSDIPLPPQFISNNFMTEYHKDASNDINRAKSIRSSI